MFPDTPHDFVDVSHGQLAHFRFGRGPDVVAIHGWPLHAATFRQILPALAADFTVHLFDLPGAGHTKWNGSIDFASNAAAIREAITALGLSSYALLAHDSGGVVARVVAADNPAVWALVLAGTEIPGHHSDLFRAIIRAAKMPGGGTVLAKSMQIPALRRSALGFGGCFTDASYADGEFAKLFVEPLLDAQVLRGQLALLKAFDFDYVDALTTVHAKITVPTLCLWGDCDQFFPIEKARSMLPQFAGGATLTAIPDAKLFLHEDHAEAFAAHTTRFLNDSR